MRKEKLTVIAYEFPEKDYGYKYLIRNQYGQGISAYKTDKGFMFWLKSRNVSLELNQSFQHSQNGITHVYDVIGEVEEKSFWHQSDIPAAAKKFTGLSNGSLVDCYYFHTENGSVIYRPNPNAKEVYKPLPLNEHLEFQRVYG